MWVTSWSNERYDQLKAISCTSCVDSSFIPCFSGVCKSSPKKKVLANRHWWHPPGSSSATAFPWNCDDVTPCIGRRPAGEGDVIRCRLVLARPFWWCLEGGAGIWYTCIHSFHTLTVSLCTLSSLLLPAKSCIFANCSSCGQRHSQ